MFWKPIFNCNDFHLLRKLEDPYFNQILDCICWFDSWIFCTRISLTEQFASSWFHRTLKYLNVHHIEQDMYNLVDIKIFQSSSRHRLLFMFWRIRYDKDHMNSGWLICYVQHTIGAYVLGNKRTITIILGSSVQFILEFRAFLLYLLHILHISAFYGIVLPLWVLMMFFPLPMSVLWIRDIKNK